MHFQNLMLDEHIQSLNNFRVCLCSHVEEGSANIYGTKK